MCFVIINLILWYRSDPEEFSSKVHELEEEKQRQAELMRKQIEEEKMKRKQEKTVSTCS